MGVDSPGFLSLQRITCHTSPTQTGLPRRYTILHPVDHITFPAKPEPIRRGSTFTFIGNPNSECVYQPHSFDAPYVCPSDRRGSTIDTPEEVWSTFPPDERDLVVDQKVPDRNSCILRYRERDLPAHFGKRVVIT
jgi:hypothetical protein